MPLGFELELLGLLELFELELLGLDELELLGPELLGPELVGLELLGPEELLELLLVCPELDELREALAPDFDELPVELLDCDPVPAWARLILPPEAGELEVADCALEDFDDGAVDGGDVELEEEELDDGLLFDCEFGGLVDG